MDGISESDISYRKLLRLAVPLILSMSGYMLMHVVDAIFLSWFSEAAIAAVVPAGMAQYLVMNTFQGMAGYTTVFVAQYIGARQPQKVASVVWQGVYLALASGFIVALLALAGRPVFAWVGHDPEVQALEICYFQIVCAGGPIILIAAALSGFFSGRGATGALLAIQIVGIVVKVVLDYVLIFGKFGFPSLGVKGAAFATLIAEGVVAVVALWGFLLPRHRRQFATLSGRAFDWAMTKSLVRFGFPNGVRFTIETLAWTVFLFFVGRVGTLELASTNIAWRINGIAFFPIIGLSQAVAILVGKAQGGRRPDLSTRVTWRGMALMQGWMVAASILFVVCPRALYAVFHTPGAAATESFEAITAIGVVLLRYVALYCLVDGFNIVLVGSLQAAGDTRWTLWAALVLHVIFVGALWLADWMRWGLYPEWVIATAFVMLQALVWLWRFLQGNWRDIRVIDTAPA